MRWSSKRNPKAKCRWSIESECFIKHSKGIVSLKLPFWINQLNRREIFKNILAAVPKFYDCLYDKNGTAVLIMEVLGRSLGYLVKKLDDKFTPKTVLMIGLQLVSQMNQLMTLFFVIFICFCLRWICSNMSTAKELFTMMSNPTILLLDTMIYMKFIFLVLFWKYINFNIFLKTKNVILDFGLSQFFNRSGNHVEPENGTVETGRGTGIYMSVYAHEHTRLSRRDDIESLTYMLIEFLRGKLWRYSSKLSYKAKMDIILYRKRTWKPEVSTLSYKCIDN